MLVWALTIHKSQELTLAEAAEKQSGLTFVAVSRIRGLKDLAFLNCFPLSRLTSIATHKNTTNRLEKERRLEGDLAGGFDCNFVDFIGRGRCGG